MATGLNMDDLDILLADLGRPKSSIKTTPVTTTAAPSNNNNNNKSFDNDIQSEIQSIIEELDAQPQTIQTISTPTPKNVNTQPQQHTASFSVSSQPAPQQQPQQQQPPPQMDGLDDLDELMESLNTSISTALKAVPSTPEEHITANNNPPASLNKNGSANTSASSLSRPANNPSVVSSTYTSSPTQPQRVTSTATVMVKKAPALSKPTDSANTSTSSMSSNVKVTANNSQPSSDDLDELLKGLSPSNPQSNNVTSVVPPPVQYYNSPAQTTATVTTQINIARQNPTTNNHNHTHAHNNNTSTNSPKVVHGDDLDNLLNNLTSQVKDIDSSGPTARGTCAGCRKPIFGETIQAMGKFYHPEHWTCHNCQTPIGTSNYFEQENLPHCQNCYQELFCSRCGHCDKPISDRCITAIGKKYHVHCFVCTQCLKPFEGGNFFERDGRPYCEADFYSTFAVRCGGCNLPVKGECINALGTSWHVEHFVCAYCQKAFTNGQFFEFGGKPYCETHYHSLSGSECGGCGKAVTGRCVEALNKRYHPEHFICAFCMNPLAGGSYTANNGKPYCKGCHSKLFC